MATKSLKAELRKMSSRLSSSMINLESCAYPEFLDFLVVSFFFMKRSDYIYGSLVSYDSGSIKAWDDLIGFQHGSKIEIHRSRWTRFRVHHRISMSNVSSVMEICFASRSRSPGRGISNRRRNRRLYWISFGPGAEMKKKAIVDLNKSRD